MALSLNKPKLDNLAGDIWKSSERLRGKFGVAPVESFNRRNFQPLRVFKLARVPILGILGMVR
jgi:hypothetical protein